VVIKRGASIGSSMPMCTSLVNWLGSNGAGLVCLQLEGLSGSGENSTMGTIISGLCDAASAAAADGAHLQLQQLCLDGDSLLAAMRLLPLLPGLQQLELTCVNLCEIPHGLTQDDPHDPRFQQLQEHPGITNLALNVTVTPDFRVFSYDASGMLCLMVQSAIPQQVQSLTLRWQPGDNVSARNSECFLPVHGLGHLKQLRQLNLDKVDLMPAATTEAAVDEAVMKHWEQVRQRYTERERYSYQFLDLKALPTLLPKLVELCGTRQTCLAVAAACSHLTGLEVGAAVNGTLAPDVTDTDKMVADLAGLQRLRKLVLPPITVADPYSMEMSSKVTRLVQLKELSITSEPGLLELQRLTALQRLTSLSLSLVRPPPTLSSSTGGVLWQDVGLTHLTGLQHLAVQGAFLGAASPAALEALTALTSFTASFDRHWQQQLPEIVAVLSSPAAQQRLRAVYAVGVVPAGVRKVYRALRRALPRTRVEVCVGHTVPAWLREAA
jgi:hypothetical protein